MYEEPLTALHNQPYQLQRQQPRFRPLRPPPVPRHQPTSTFSTAPSPAHPRNCGLRPLSRLRPGPLPAPAPGPRTRPGRVRCPRAGAHLAGPGAPCRVSGLASPWSATLAQGRCIQMSEGVKSLAVRPPFVSPDPVSSAAFRHTVLSSPWPTEGGPPQGQGPGSCTLSVLSPGAVLHQLCFLLGLCSALGG